MTPDRLKALSIEPFVPGKKVEVMLSDRKMITLQESLLPLIVNQKQGA